MNLQHNFLIAMPFIQDPLFKRSVVYICEHDEEEGAMGLIVNKPIGNLTIEGVLKKLKITPKVHSSTMKLDKPVFAGGPLAEDRGFILHSAQHVYTSSIRISNNTIITTSRDVLEAMGTDNQPEEILVALGYCAWEKTQLENELMGNAWLTVPAETNILFQTPIADRWREAARSMGVDIQNMTSDVGHA
ncbi:YqgE/AlgH family protein [Pantoea sp. Mhis]|uniref:YqgE/AlgH family protein n=1 Tax=Pantoea sp. Mhis TaxID=2576759 RepID=UPI0013590C60|nr:YqgE/AlgH family protein [Pantoea sp. Mhis]MXP56689.1 YqgE/AlgH family protein [Pantoea sp. Mhis]